MIRHRELNSDTVGRNGRTASRSFALPMSSDSRRSSTDRMRTILSLLHAKNSIVAVAQHLLSVPCRQTMRRSQLACRLVSHNVGR